MKTSLFSFALACFFAARLGAQATTVSQVSGVIQDATGAAIPGAKLTMTNTETSAVRIGESGTDGAYSFTNLAVGPYRLQVTKEGFSSYIQTGIVLQLNSNPQINVGMKIGIVSERVEVQANAAMIETQSNGVGQVIDQQRILEMPLNGRNVGLLVAALAGAAVTSTNGGLASNLNYPTVVAVAIAGAQNNATNYFLDGGMHIDPRTNVGLPLPFPDSLQEFKVETSVLPANYGNHPGGAVNVVTKSGTNAFHGDAFYFLRNYVFNARNFFAAQRDSLKRNQYGGVIGGPIIKDKLFFFAGYQGTIERTDPATVLAFVPTADVLKGDLRTILSTPCQARAINILPAYATNNIISVSRFNPGIVKFLGLLPVASDPCGKIFYGVPRRTSEGQGVTRLDWQRTATDTIFARYFITDFTQDAIYDKSNILTAGTPGLLDRVQSLILGNTHLITNSLVSSFRLSYSRSAVQRVDADGIPNPADLGSNVNAPIKNYIGQNFGPTGYFATGAIPGWVYTNIYNFSEDLGYTHGSHQMSIGINWLHTKMNSTGPFQMNPRFTFGTNTTASALAGFLLGLPDQVLQGGGQVGRDYQNAPSLYFQDAWKLTRRFQLNLGVRWDPFLPQQSKYGYASQFDVNGFYNNQHSTAYVNAPAGLTFPGDKDYPGRSDTAPQYANFAPRFGFVFDPRGKGTETIRGGYGLFYDSSYLWNTLHVPLNAPWGNTITLDQPVGGFTNPWQNYPGGNPFPTKTPIPANVQFPTFGTYVFEPKNSSATYMQQWNLAIQKQFGPQWLVSASYLGNKTTHQWLGAAVNPAIYIPGNCTAGQYGLTAAGPCSSTANTNNRRQFLLANPTQGIYYGQTDMTDTSGNASYNGLLLSAQHRFAHNFSIFANYTWSHCLNQGEATQDIVNYYQDYRNRRAEWGNCNADRRQIFNFSGVLRTPKVGNSLVQKITGNWQLSPIFTAVSGAWLTVIDGTDISRTGLANDRPNVVSDWHVAKPTIDQWFNNAAFVAQPVGTFGTAGRSVILGPGSWNVDASLSRSFAIREGHKLDLRWETFNVLNHARFQNPGVSLSSGTTLGRINSALDPRIMQVALKYTF